MQTATANDGHPDNLPIWARLNLAKQGIAFGDVDGWELMADKSIYVFLMQKPFYALLHKR